MVGLSIALFAALNIIFVSFSERKVIFYSSYTSYINDNFSLICILNMIFYKTLKDHLRIILKGYSFLKKDFWCKISLKIETIKTFTEQL